jgi:hypothetical protein
MKGNRAVVMAVLAVVLLLAGWWLFMGGGVGPQPIDLIALLDGAEKRPPSTPFEVMDVELDGQTRRAIYAPPPTRITYKVKVPDDAWLRVAVGMKPESWNQPGDGALFFVGVSDGPNWEVLFSQHVNPFNNPGDRKWIPVWVDLSAYAGEQIDLIFNTRASQGQTEDSRNDHPLWGAPELVVR